MTSKSKMIKTYVNDATREYLQQYFLSKPCTPSTIDYLLYNMFNVPFSVASSTTEFDEDNENELSTIETFLLQLSKKYLFHYGFVDRESICVKGVIEAWVHTKKEDKNEEDEEILYRFDRDRWDDEDEEKTLVTLLFWMKENGKMVYQDKDNEEDEIHYLPIEKNMVVILLDEVEYQPYLGSEEQQYIIVQLII